MINLHFGTSNYLHRKYKYTSRKQYSLGLFFSGNAKKIHTDQNIIQVHLLCLKANDLQTLKSSNCKKWFFSVYVIGTTYFNECWKTLFLIKVCCHRLSSTAYFWNKWFERSPYFIFYLLNNITIIISKFQNKELLFVLVEFS